MGKAAILIIAASIAMGSMYSLAAKDDARQAEARLSTHQYEVLARNAALAGYNRAKQALTDDFDSAPAELTGSYAGSDYEVTVTKNGNTARVKAIGKSVASDGTEVDFTVDSSIEKEVVIEIAEQAPPFMRYALVSDEDLTLKGNVELITYLTVEGNEENTLNANMHTNGSLSISGGAAKVRGFGTYVHSGSGMLDETFDPYYNPGDNPVASRVNAVEIPTFDATEFLSYASVDQHSTGYVELLAPEYNLGGTRENPYIWHIQGDFSSTISTKIDGYTIFVVEGDVTLSGNFTGTQSDYDGSDESNIAVYATGTVEMGGTSELHGQIFAESGIEFHGTPLVVGSLTSNGPITLKGTPNIQYREASPALTTMFEAPDIYFNLASYSEF